MDTRKILNTRKILAVHADWSMSPTKRWMTASRHAPDGWQVSAPEPVGDTATLFQRLLARAEGAPVAFGIDCPIGVPRAYAQRHLAAFPDFPSFLRSLRATPGFFEVAPDLAEISAARPFYPARGMAGMTRLSHAQALGLADASGLGRVCDKATVERPAGAPVFWTLGANQSGKAAIAAWRDLFLPAMESREPPGFWPFEGPFTHLLQPNRVAVAETYPAEAMRHLGIVPAGSKRRQSDRALYGPALHAAMSALGAKATPALAATMADGFGADACGEDRFDSVLGVLCVLGVLLGRRPDVAPAELWIRRWEGWVLGQTALPPGHVSAPGR